MSLTATALYDKLAMANRGEMAKIILTKHTSHQITIRKITEDDVKKVIKSPIIRYKSKRFRNAYKLIGKVKQDEIFVVVVYKKKVTVVITAGRR